MKPVVGGNGAPSGKLKVLLAHVWFYPELGGGNIHVQRIAEWEPPPAAAHLRRLIDGRAVMRATGLAPGPAVGRVLEAVEEAAAAGAVRDEAEAVRLAVELAAGERRTERD